MKKVDTKDVEEISFEESIRPQLFEGFIGQEDIKDGLSLSIEASLKRNSILDHILFYGAPGLGKTTLAKIVSNEYGSSNFHVTSGAVIEKPSDLINSLIKLEDRDILFIDEIHRLPKVVEEFLYPALEDRAIDLIVDDKKKGKKTERVELAKFTVIGATTRAGMISAPLRSRFGIDYRMEFYDAFDLKFIAKRTARILNVEIEENAASLLGECSRGTPRITNRLIRRCQDYADIKASGKITIDVVENTLRMLKIDKNGLNHIDHTILNTMVEVFGCKPVGISSIGATINEDQETIETIHEPYLIQQGYIERTPRGRVVTEKGIKLVEGKKENE